MMRSFLMILSLTAAFAQNIRVNVPPLIFDSNAKGHNILAHINFPFITSNDNNRHRLAVINVEYYPERTLIMVRFFHKNQKSPPSVGTELYTSSGLSIGKIKLIQVAPVNSSENTSIYKDFILTIKKLYPWNVSSTPLVSSAKAAITKILSERFPTKQFNPANLLLLKKESLTNKDNSEVLFETSTVVGWRNGIVYDDEVLDPDVHFYVVSEILMNYPVKCIKKVQRFSGKGDNKKPFFRWTTKERSLTAIETLRCVIKYFPSKRIFTNPVTFRNMPKTNEILEILTKHTTTTAFDTELVHKERETLRLRVVWEELMSKPVDVTAMLNTAFNCLDNNIYWGVNPTEFEGRRVAIPSVDKVLGYFVWMNTLTSFIRKHGPLARELLLLLGIPKDIDDPSDVTRQNFPQWKGKFVAGVPKGRGTGCSGRFRAAVQGCFTDVVNNVKHQIMYEKHILVRNGSWMLFEERHHEETCTAESFLTGAVEEFTANMQWAIKLEKRWLDKRTKQNDRRNYLVGERLVKDLKYWSLGGKSNKIRTRDIRKIKFDNQALMGGETRSGGLRFRLNEDSCEDYGLSPDWVKEYNAWDAHFIADMYKDEVFDEEDAINACILECNFSLISHKLVIPSISCPSRFDPNDGEAVKDSFQGWTKKRVFSLSISMWQYLQEDFRYYMCKDECTKPDGKQGMGFVVGHYPPAEAKAATGLLEEQYRDPSSSTRTRKRALQWEELILQWTQENAKRKTNHEYRIKKYQHDALEEMSAWWRRIENLKTFIRNW